MPGHYIAVGLYSGVAVKRGSTVLCIQCNNVVYNNAIHSIFCTQYLMLQLADLHVLLRN